MIRNHILHVLSTPRAEGTPNLVLDWLRVGPELGLQQSVMVLNSQPADLTIPLRENSNWYHEHNLFTSSKTKFPKISLAAYHASKELSPDLVVCWPTGFANWVCAGAKLAGVRKLIVHAGNPPNRGRRLDWISRYGMWPLWLLRSHVVCCSKYVENEYRSIPFVPKSIFTSVHNCARVEGVAERADAARQSRIQDGNKYAIMVATLERHKDHETILRAVPTIVKREPNFRLRLVGDGSLRLPLEAFAKESQIENYVDFLGTRKDIPELLGTSDLFVLSTTRQEGLGTVLIEALAAGLPVVASDVPACRELLVDGKFGRLVKPSDPQELARHICELLVTGGNTDGNSQDYGKGFTPERMLTEYLQVSGGPLES